MEFEHKKNSIILKASNPSQLFMLGRIYQKFPNLGLKKVMDKTKQFPDVVGIELPDASLDMLLIDSLTKFNTE